MKFKKITALAITSVLCLSSLNVSFGEEMEILTIEKAVDKAVKYSKTLKSYEEENIVNDEKINRVKTNFLASGDVEQIANLAVQLKNLYAQSEKNKLSAADEKELIEYSVFSFFIDIIKAENNLKLYNEELLLKSKKLKVSEIKLKYGRISENDYDNELLEYNSLSREKEELENLIDNAYISLNKVLGANLNTKYILDLGEEITYNYIGDVNLDSKIAISIDTDNSIKSQQNNVDIAKYSLNLFTAESENNTSYAKLVEYNKELRSLENEKTSLKESIIKNYNEIIKNENEYKSNLTELDNMKNQLKIKELNLKLGKITELDVEEYKYEISKLENTIKEQTYEHELLMRKFENPTFL